MNKLILAGAVIAATAYPALAQIIVEGGGRMAPGPQSRADAEAQVRERFGRMDANKDGFVTRDEIRNMTQAMIASGQARTFDALDTDKNGSLSREEFAAGRGPVSEQVVVRMRGPGDMPPPPPGATDLPKPPKSPELVRDGEMMMIERRSGGAGDIFMMGAIGADGRISIDAVVKQTLARFDEADTNKDGMLSPAERKAARDARRIEWRGQQG